MLSLRSHHITDLFVVVDDILPKGEKPQGGRPNLMTNFELITALVWNSLKIHSKTIKDLYIWLDEYHRHDFRNIPKYADFVAQCQRVIPLLIYVIDTLLLDKTAIRIMDSTMLGVCKLQRADDRKVCKGLADFGKNHQGWHFGFKLHVAIDLKGRLCGLCFTPANIHDSRAETILLNKYAKIAVGDGTYGGRAMNDHIFDEYGTIVIAPPHPK